MNISLDTFQYGYFLICYELLGATLYIILVRMTLFQTQINYAQLFEKWLKGKSMVVLRFDVLSSLCLVYFRGFWLLCFDCDISFSFVIGISIFGYLYCANKMSLFTRNYGANFWLYVMQLLICIKVKNNTKISSCLNWLKV